MCDGALAASQPRSVRQQEGSRRQGGCDVSSLPSAHKAAAVGGVWLWHCVGGRGTSKREGVCAASLPTTMGESGLCVGGGGCGGLRGGGGSSVLCTPLREGAQNMGRVQVLHSISPGPCGAGLEMRGSREGGRGACLCNSVWLAASQS